MRHRNDANERVFFIIKYLLMGSLETFIFLIVVFFMGSVDFWQAFLIGLLNLTGLTLVISRRIEKPIDRLSFIVVRVLNRFPRVKRVIVKYL